MLERLRLVGRAPDVGVGRVGLLDAVAIGQVVLDQPAAHLGAAAELADEVGVEPRLVDPQARVGQQAVAVEPLDVVALEGRAVAPDVHVVGLHRPHQHGAGDGPAERGGVEVGAAGRADVERAAGQRGEARPRPARGGSRPPGPARRRTAAPAPGRWRCRARRTARCRRCRRTARRPCRASRRPRPRCRGRRRRRCRRVRRRGCRSGPCSLWSVSPSAVCGLRQLEQVLGQALAAARIAGDHQDGVIPGDRAEHLGQPGAVEGAGQEVATRRAACAARPGSRWPRPRRAARPAAGPAAAAGRRRPPGRSAARRPRARRRPAARRRACAASPRPARRGRATAWPG